MPQQPDKPSIPPLSTPVRSFNQPPHIEHQERVWVEQVDITASSYVEAPRGTLYSEIQGADVRLVAAHPTMYLLREIIDPQRFPYAFRYWGFGEVFTTKTIGQRNLTPDKYKRLVRTVETDQPVSAGYDFPAGLTGDQVEIVLQQETIEEARLKITEEVIALTGDAILGGDLSEFGPLAIYETVVNEGTAIDTGFLVLKSTVTPFGNGKAVKITVKYPLDLALKKLLTKTLGQENLTPAKYRRLVQRQETKTFVDPATYSFPAFLTGDQVELEYIEEAIYRARLKITDEIIAIGADPLTGADGDEYGRLAVYESIVNEGTAIEEGFLIKHSSVTPFGNGKAVKITLAYKTSQVAAVKVTAGGSGYGSAPAVTFSGGGGSGAAATALLTGGVVTGVKMTNQGTGYTSQPTVSFASGAAAATAYLGTTLLTSRLFDQEMLVHYDESRQIVMIGTPDSPDEDYVLEETRQLDVWRALRTRSKKVPTAVDEATAVVEYHSRPYAFPGLFPSFPAVAVGSNLVYIPTGYRKTTATLTQARILAYWVLSSTTPVVTGDTIITDSIFVFTAEDIEGHLATKRFEGVLHDAMETTYFAGAIGFSADYPATTPSYSEYTGISKSALTGTVTLTNASTAVVGSGTLFLSEVDVGDLFDGLYVVASVTDNTHLTLGVVAVGGGSGLPAFVVHTDTSSAWMGNEKIVSASVTATGHARLWKVQVEKIVMR